MRIIALVERPDHVCCRYRIAAFKQRFEDNGHQLDLRSWPKSCWSRMRLGSIIDRADAVILQRRLLTAGQLYLLRRHARQLIFDFDDAVFLRDSYAKKGMDCPRRLLAFAAMCETADVLIAGNAFLREQALRWTKPERVHVIPTCVDPARYTLAEHGHNSKSVELVWIGSSSTLQGLERIRPLLEEIGRRCPGVALKLVCDRFLHLEYLPVIPRDWSEDREAVELAASDIGLSWIPDDAWSRGKCGLKVLQYMAAGLPVVGNPVGVQAEMIRHGENGFLARTPQDWIEAIGLLARDPALRQRMGQAGRARVEADFSTHSGAGQWVQLLARMAPISPKRPRKDAA